MKRSRQGQLMALAAAGGLWAWQNRDKIQRWITTQRNQMSQSGAATGPTRRLDATPTDPDNPTQTPSDPFRAGI